MTDALRQGRAERRAMHEQWKALASNKHPARAVQRPTACSSGAKAPRLPLPNEKGSMPSSRGGDPQFPRTSAKTGP